MMRQDLFEHGDYDIFVTQSEIVMGRLTEQLTLLQGFGAEMIEHLVQKIEAMGEEDSHYAVLSSEVESLSESVDDIRIYLGALKREQDGWGDGLIIIDVDFLREILAELFVAVTVIVNASGYYADAGMFPVDVCVSFIVQLLGDYETISNKLRTDFL